MLTGIMRYTRKLRRRLGLNGGNSSWVQSYFEKHKVDPSKAGVPPLSSAVEEELNGYFAPSRRAMQEALGRCEET